jgi:hypothetical protein
LSGTCWPTVRRPIERQLVSRQRVIKRMPPRKRSKLMLGWLGSKGNPSVPRHGKALVERFHEVLRVWWLLRNQGKELWVDEATGRVVSNFPVDETLGPELLARVSAVYDDLSLVARAAGSKCWELELSIPYWIHPLSILAHPN